LNVGDFFFLLTAKNQNMNTMKNIANQNILYSITSLKRIVAPRLVCNNWTVFVKTVF